MKNDEVIYMKEVEIGKIFLSEELIKIVEEHKNSMLEAHKDNPDVYNMLLKAPFGPYLSDLLFKFGFRLGSDYGI